MPAKNHLKMLSAAYLLLTLYCNVSIGANSVDHDQTKLSKKFILLITVKMPIIVGILTIISKINTSEYKSKKMFYIAGFSFYEQLKFHAHLS